MAFFNIKPIKPIKTLGLKTILFLLIIFTIIKLFLYVFIGNAIQATDLSAQNIINAINNERNLRNLSILKIDSRLSTAGQQKATDMIVRHYFSHTDPEGNYIWLKIVAAGYTPYAQLGENLAIEFYNTESLVSAWMNSPTHRANILNESFADQGMGLDFGNTQNEQYHSAIVNTFGTLAIKKTSTAKKTTTTTAKPKTQSKPAVKSSVTTTTTPANASSDLATNAEPPQQTAPDKISNDTNTTSETINQIALRGEQLQPDFNISFSHASSASAGLAPTASMLSLEPLIGKVPELGNPLLNKINRYVSMGLVFIFIVLLLYDIKEIVAKKIGSLDKKINNLFLLIMAFLAIAIIYWM